jgi:DNA polymerase-3 subunit epsilon
MSTVQGEVITRAYAKRLAEQAGLVPKTGVSKGLDLLVIADPDSMSGKAKKARDYGVRIIAEREFWGMIGIVVN